MLRTSHALLLSILLLPWGATAQMPGRHPGYDRALSDLRYARALLETGSQWGRVARDDERAVAEIDRAIEEVRHAAWEDGKNPNARPAVDAHWLPGERLRRAQDVLGRARRDLDHEEDNPSARGLRNRAWMHIDEAQRAVAHAINMWH
jgi:hypothetical protein